MSGRIFDPNTQFVRIKSLANETFFITCQPRDTVGYVKACVSIISGVAREDLKLYIKNRLLEDESTLYEQQVGNDAILYMIRKKNDGDWENVSRFLNPEEPSPRKTGVSFRPESTMS